MNHFSMHVDYGYTTLISCCLERVRQVQIQLRNMEATSSPERNNLYKVPQLWIHVTQNPHAFFEE